MIVLAAVPGGENAAWSVDTFRFLSMICIAL
jgi:hypothetical protein